MDHGHSEMKESDRSKHLKWDAPNAIFNLIARTIPGPWPVGRWALSEGCTRERGVPNRDTPRSGNGAFVGTCCCPILACDVRKQQATNVITKQAVLLPVSAQPNINNFDPRLRTINHHDSLLFLSIHFFFRTCLTA